MTVVTSEQLSKFIELISSCKSVSTNMAGGIDKDIIFRIKENISVLVGILDAVKNRSFNAENNIIFVRNICEYKMLLEAFLLPQSIDLKKFNLILLLLQIIADHSFIISDDSSSKEIISLKQLLNILINLYKRCLCQQQVSERDLPMIDRAMLSFSYGGLSGRVGDELSGRESHKVLLPVRFRKALSSPELKLTSIKSPQEVLNPSSINDSQLSFKTKDIMRGEECNFRKDTMEPVDFSKIIQNQFDLAKLSHICLQYAYNAHKNRYEAGFNIFLDTIKRIFNLKSREKLTYNRAVEYINDAIALCTCAYSVMSYQEALTRIEQKKAVILPPIRGRRCVG